MAKIGQRLFYTVVAVALLVILCLLHGSPVYETNDITPNKRRLLTMRAKTSWLNSDPQPLTARDYLHSKNSTSNNSNIAVNDEDDDVDYIYESSEDQSLMGNLLNLDYWYYDDQSSTVERRLFTKETTATKLNKVTQPVPSQFDKTAETTAINVNKVTQPVPTQFGKTAETTVTKLNKATHVPEQQDKTADSTVTKMNKVTQALTQSGKPAETTMVTVTKFSNVTGQSNKPTRRKKVTQLPRPQFNKTEEKKNISAQCPKRRPVVFTENGQRQIPSELYNMAPTIFDTVPTQFMKGIRNPCWQDGEEIRCLPAFFLVGFPKAGTTDLWAKISSHPQKVPSLKEPHYWTRKRIDGSPLKSYNGKYKGISSKIKEKLPGMQDLIVGDGSASTMWDNHKWFSYFDFDACKEEGPQYLIADVIHTVLPNSKILVILRNPTDRLYSDYIYFGGIQRTPNTFNDEVKETIDWFNTCLLIASRRTCAYSNKKEFNGKKPSVRLLIGLYSIYVRDWLNIFSRDQFIFLRLEDWHGRCTDILPQVYNFLELATLPPSRIEEICSTKQRNPTRRKVGPMLNKTRHILDEFYLSTKQELAAVLEDNKFLWK